MSPSKTGFLNLPHELGRGNNPTRFIHHTDQTFMKRDGKSGAQLSALAATRAGNY